MATQEVPGTGETTGQDDNQGVLRSLNQAEKKKLGDLLRAIQSGRNDVSAAQAEVNACLADVKSLNVNKDAAKFALRIAALDQDKRDGVIFSLWHCIEALGLGVQGDFFGPRTRH